MLTLAISGFVANPAAVTSLLGLQPSRTAVAGQPPAEGRGKTYDFNGWWLEVRSQILRSRGVEHAEALAEIVTLLRGRESQFQRLRHELKPTQIEIFGAMAVPWNEQCGLWLDAADMAVLAGCGIGWGIDLVSITSTETKPL